MRVVQSVLLTLAVAAISRGQDPYYWTTDFVAGAGPCQLCVYDVSGAVVAALPFPGFLVSPQIAKHPAGTVWVTEPLTGQVIPYTLTGGMGTPFAAQNVGDLCIDIAGDLWLYSGGLFSPGLLQRRDTAGNLLQSLPVQGTIAAEIKSDAFGNVWVMDALQSTLERVSPAGVLTGPFSAGVTGTAGSLEIDPSGNPWMLINPGPTAVVAKVSGTGAPLFTVSLPNAIDIVVDGLGRVRVLLTNAGIPQITVLDTNGATLTAYPLGSGQTYEGIEVDAGGRSWLSSLTAGSLEVWSCSGQFINSIALTVPSLPAGKGDQTGHHVVSVLARNSDSDGDGVPNFEELGLGTDALDSNSVPPLLLMSGAAAPGQTFSVSMSVPADAGYSYVIGASLGNAGIPIAPFPWCRQIPLSFDAFLAFWLSPANVLTTGAVGTVSALGQAASSTFIPSGPYSGISFFMGGVTVNPSTLVIGSVTAALPITIQ